MRTSKLLKDRKIQIFEDLTQDTKDARNKLWPLVEQVRKEGKTAGFRGSYALIDNKKIMVNDMKSNDTWSVLSLGVDNLFAMYLVYNNISYIQSSKVCYAYSQNEPLL